MNPEDLKELTEDMVLELTNGLEEDEMEVKDNE